MKSPLLLPGFRIPNSNSKPEHLSFTCVASFEVYIPHQATWNEHVTAGNYDALASDVNEKNFPIDEVIMALTSTGIFEVVFATVEPASSSRRDRVSTRLLHESLKGTGYQHAPFVIHARCSRLYGDLSDGCSIVSIGSKSPNWRGYDSETSFPATCRYDKEWHLTNFLLKPKNFESTDSVNSRTWRSGTIYMLYRQLH